MTFAAFDTHEFVKTLEKAGLPEAQAEAISVAVRKSHESLDVATKQDIAELRHEIGDLRKDMEKLGLQLTVRLGLMIAAAIPLTLSLAKFLHL